MAIKLIGDIEPLKVIMVGIVDFVIQVGLIIGLIWTAMFCAIFVGDIGDNSGSHTREIYIFGFNLFHASLDYGRVGESIL